MKRSSSQCFKLVKGVQYIRMFLFAFRRHVTKFTKVSKSDAEREHFNVSLLEGLNDRSWISAVGVAISYEE